LLFEGLNVCSVVFVCKVITKGMERVLVPEGSGTLTDKVVAAMTRRVRYDDTGARGRNLVRCGFWKV
jgi:hypothetical protein